jgi:hypothetical protein
MTGSTFKLVRAGLMFLPLAVGFDMTVGGGPQLPARTSERVTPTIGLALGTAGTVGFRFVTVQSSIFAVLIPASVVGGALGLAILATVATSTTYHAASGTAVTDALTNGYTAGLKTPVTFLSGIRHPHADRHSTVRTTKAVAQPACASRSGHRVACTGSARPWTA